MQVNWLVGSVILLGIFLLRMKPKKKNLLPIQMNLSDERFKNLKYYIQAQAVHESNNFTSTGALTRNNLFGMGVPSKRTFLGTKDPKSQYAVFPDYETSVKDLMEWMKYTNFPNAVKNSAEYVKELKVRGYFEDSTFNYLRGMNSALNKLDSDSNRNFKISSF